MNASLEWIKQYVKGLDCTAEEYKDAVTLTGTMVEGYERRDEDLEKMRKQLTASGWFSSD